MFKNTILRNFALSTFIGNLLLLMPFQATALERIEYNHPGLAVDLGVGLWGWPLPMDYDQDGDYDLVVSCTDKPFNGVYFFENKTGDETFPVFEPPLRLGDGLRNVQISYVDGKARILTLNQERVDFREHDFEMTKQIYPVDNVYDTEGRIRANQWKYSDYDGDNDLDLIVGVGDWTEYGWDDAYNDEGVWENGPLHGYVYLVRNNGTSDEPDYAEPEKIMAGGKPIDVYGMPSPNLADFDGDGDLDILCGEFVDSLTYFENKGTRQEPEYAEGRKLEHGGKLIKMDLCMIVPVAIDWDKDGDVDLVIGQEDGRVAFLENTGEISDGIPQFNLPEFFKQKEDKVKVGALVTPYGVDWDNDGDEDLICGNTAGRIVFVENLNGEEKPKWAAPIPLKANGEVIRIMAGENGSIQGPCEAKWGYTTLSVADWDGDGLQDIVVNSIWGKVVWFKNVGSKGSPKLAEAQPVKIDWEGSPQKPEWNWWEPDVNEMVSQWRTTPYVIDLNHDGLNDLVMLDHEGYLAFYERVKKSDELILSKPERIFNIQTEDGIKTLQLNDGYAGSSGRKKICMVDWDIDGKIDLLVNDRNVRFYKNISDSEDEYLFSDQGLVDERILAGHTTSPTVVDWNKDNVPDLLVGAEDGLMYYMENPHYVNTDK